MIEMRSFAMAAVRSGLFPPYGHRTVPGNAAGRANYSRSVQVDFNTTESVVTVDWENGFVETSAKDGTNVSKVFKELLNQAKVKYNLSPALSMRRKRRQSLPPPNNGSGPATGTSSAQASPAIPSLAQLQHLEQIREKHSGGKRNSCILS